MPKQKIALSLPGPTPTVPVQQMVDDATQDLRLQFAALQRKVDTLAQSIPPNPNGPPKT